MWPPRWGPFHFTSLWSLKNRWQNAAEQYINNIFKRLSFKKVCSITLGFNTSSWRLGLRLYEWVLRSGKIQRRTCWSFDKTAANKPSSRLATSWSTCSGIVLAIKIETNAATHQCFKSLIVGWIRKGLPCGRPMQYLGKHDWIKTRSSAVAARPRAASTCHWIFC